MIEDLSDYAYLWTTNKHEYALIKYEGPDGGVGIFNVIRRTAMVIENDAMAKVVVEKMIGAGVAVLSRIPPA